jgi:hypothetical protein
MRSGLFLTTLIGLAGASHLSSAADATWIAVTFDPGSGARPFQVTNSITPCVTVFAPKA